MLNNRDNGLSGGKQKIGELLKRVQVCRSELLDLLKDWHHMNSIVHSRIMFLYETIFGDLEYQLEQKHRDACELERRVELLSIKQRNGEELTDKTLSFVDKMVKREFKRTAKGGNIKQSYSSKTQDRYNCSGKTKDTDGESDVPFFYRQIVKMLHPDVAGDNDNFKNYWDSVQDAYHKKNERHLEIFYEIFCYEMAIETESNIQEEECLRNEITRLEMNIAKEKLRIKQLKQEEPFVFEDKLGDTMWIERRKRQLRGQIFQIDRKIFNNKKMLRHLSSFVSSQ